MSDNKEAEPTNCINPELHHEAGHVAKCYPSASREAEIAARLVPEQFSTGGDKHNAAKAWLDGYDTLLAQLQQSLDRIKLLEEELMGIKG